MQQFVYTIRDPAGIHARPAGLLAKAAREFPDTVITVASGEKRAAAGQLIKLMGMGVRQGDRVTVTAEGPSEERDIAAIGRLLQEKF